MDFSAADEKRIQTAAEDGFAPLFNGSDLSGWRPVNTAPTTWKVEDGMLICSGKLYYELRSRQRELVTGGERRACAPMHASVHHTVVTHGENGSCTENSGARP